jgi:hypothetical protein
MPYMYKNKSFSVLEGCAKACSLRRRANVALDAENVGAFSFGVHAFVAQVAPRRVESLPNHVLSSLESVASREAVSAAFVVAAINSNTAADADTATTTN